MLKQRDRRHTNVDIRLRQTQVILSLISLHSLNISSSHRPSPQYLRINLEGASNGVTNCRHQSCAKTP
uniref:Uncharacterized protein n=1 Tax=Rhizophora mucronata TaxID=61149 RepID=A0A2P2IR19_RHIMU